jgi:hypothetical protein
VLGPPAHAEHVLRFQLLAAEARHRLECGDAEQVVALALAVIRAELGLEDVLAEPDAGAGVGEDEPGLLQQLSSQGLFVRLAFVHAAAGCRPEAPVRELEAYEQNPVGWVEDDRADRVAEAGRAQPSSSRRARNQHRRSA